jgi:hypothetical protein
VSGVGASSGAITGALSVSVKNAAKQIWSRFFIKLEIPEIAIIFWYAP